MLEGDLGKLKRGLERIPRTTFRAVEKAFQQSGQQFQRQMVLTRFRPYTSWKNTSDQMQSRSSFLKKSIGYKVTGTTFSDLELRVFSAGLKYANLQEYGGTVRPVNSKYLAIPLPAALDKRGTPLKKSPRDYPDAFLLMTGNVKSRGVQLYIARIKEKAPPKRKSKKAPQPDKLEFLYLLRRSVKIPPRLGFRKTWNGLGQSRIRRIRAGFQRGLREAFGGPI